MKKHYTKKTVANKELWLELIPFFESPVFSFHKVQAHSGDKYNDIVDELAVSAKLCQGGFTNIKCGHLRFATTEDIAEPTPYFLAS